MMDSKASSLESPAETSKEQNPDKKVRADVQKASTSVVEDVPDPDEDDLDDLDDMLDEFSSPKVDLKEPTPSKSGPGRPAQIPENSLGIEGMTDEDFAKQLQAGMADLLGGMEKDPEMQARFEAMMKELGAPELPEQVIAGKSDTSSSKAKADIPPSAAEESFQETIKKTMERMQASGDQATAAAAADDSDDLIAELMKQMAASGMDGEGNEEDFSKMLLGMMEQLTNKEILYEPMKELDDRFPAWLENNKSKTSKEDLSRYLEQQRVVHDIVAKFEQKTYADSNAADREYIVDRMHKMQAAGAPPPDLVGEMAAAQEAFGMPDEGCPQQ